MTKTPIRAAGLTREQRELIKQRGERNEPPRNAHEASLLGIAWEPKLLDRPTSVRPGTTEKVQLMADRLNAGQDIHHPNDLQYDTDESDPRWQIPIIKEPDTDSEDEL